VKVARLSVAADPMPNMTAMVDLIMCILVFFMLASRFIAVETFLPGALPTDQGLSAAPPAGDIPPTSLLVDLSAGGGLGVTVDLPQSGTRIAPPAAVAADEPAQLAAMQRYMAQVTAALRQIQRTTAGGVRVVLRPAPEVEYRHLVRVFGALLDADFKQVAFAAGRAG
jgi:biopolymer transport protein ExbD